MWASIIEINSLIREQDRVCASLPDLALVRPTVLEHLFFSFILVLHQVVSVVFLAEHMLFYASAKYPVEDSYSKYITEVFPDALKMQCLFSCLHFAGHDIHCFHLLLPSP